MIKFTSTSEYSFFDDWPDYWPSQDMYVSQHDVCERQYQEFKTILDSESSETEIEKFLSVNRELLSFAASLFSTGHHASWLFPKQHIRPSSGTIGGMIPDYVLAGANSDGVSWFVLELKGANHKAFTKQKKRVFLSNVANKGVCQLINYIDISTRSQGYLRDELNLKGYREPKGILLIGNGKETNDSLIREFKGAWNRLNQQVQIVSYNRLLRLVKTKLESIKS